MDNYFKSISLNFDVKDGLAKASAELQKWAKETRPKLFGADNKALPSLGVFAQNSFALKSVQGFEKSIDELFTGEDGIKGMATTAIGAIVDFAKSAWESATAEMKSVLSYWDNTDETSWTNKMVYGMSSAESYAMNKALGRVGFSSIEDLAIKGSDTQINEFYKVFQATAEKYGNLIDSGFFDSLQEFNYELEEFNDEIRFGVVDFFAENKEKFEKLGTAFMDFIDKSLPTWELTLDIIGKLYDVIMPVMQIAIFLGERLLTAVNGILDWLGKGSTSVYNSYNATSASAQLTGSTDVVTFINGGSL